MASASKPAARPLAELLTGSIDPLVRKRGLARAELLAWWPDIVGAAYAGHTLPERIRWPRDGTAATLFVRCDPAFALQLAHEADRVRERANAYFGYPAIGAVRIVQRATGRPAPVSAPPPLAAPLSPALEARLERFDEPLRQALRVLAARVLAAT
jgi:hypothetical protein